MLIIFLVLIKYAKIGAIIWYAAAITKIYAMCSFPENVKKKQSAVSHPKRESEIGSTIFDVMQININTVISISGRIYKNKYFDSKFSTFF